MTTKEELQAQVNELKTERDLLRTLINTLPDIIFAKDAEGRFLVNNQAHLRVMGVDTQEDVLGKTDLDIFPGQFGERYYADDRQIIETGKAKINREEPVIGEDGTEHWLSSTKIPWRNSAGEIMGILGISRDITEYKRVLEENQHLVEELEERVKERTSDLATFRAMAENSQDAIMMVGDVNFVYANKAAHDLFGYDYEKQEMIGLNGMDFWPKEKQAMLQETVIPQAMAGGWRGEMQQKRKDGASFMAESNVFVVRDDDGEILNVTIITRDITERKQAEAERERLQQQVINAQKRLIQELSTPVIPVMDRIIVMPLIGSIDSMRARDITRTLLAGIREHQARIVIFDVTGVPIVDSGVALHLNKTIQAARLKGAQTILTGISDAVAEAIVDLGIDWSDMKTLSDLQTGLRFALSSLGIKLARD